MAGQDKRKYIRVPVEVEFRVTEDGADEHGHLFFYSRNVSKGGAFLISDLLLQKGSTVFVKFQLPGENLIEVLAEVVWVDEADGQEAGMGIEFTRFTPENRAAIERFLDRQTAAKPQ